MTRSYNNGLSSVLSGLRFFNRLGHDLLFWPHCWLIYTYVCSNFNFEDGFYLSNGCSKLESPPLFLIPAKMCHS